MVFASSYWEAKKAQASCLAHLLSLYISRIGVILRKVFASLKKMECSAMDDRNPSPPISLERSPVRGEEELGQPDVIYYDQADTVFPALPACYHQKRSSAPLLAFADLGYVAGELDCREMHTPAPPPDQPLQNGRSLRGGRIPDPRP